MATSPRTSFHRVFLRIIRLFFSVCLCPCWSKRIFDLSHLFFCLPCVSFHIIVLYLQRNRGQSSLFQVYLLNFSAELAPRKRLYERNQISIGAVQHSAASTIADLGQCKARLRIWTRLALSLCPIR